MLFRSASDGTLVIGVYYHGKGDSGNDEKASLLYSSDNGVTWNRTEDVDTGSSENEVVELEDGTIRMFYRGGSGRISYADFTKNADGGYDVGTHVDISECSVTSSCNMGAITYSKKINGKQAVLVRSEERRVGKECSSFFFDIRDYDFLICFCGVMYCDISIC